MVINIKSVLRLHVVDFYAQRYSTVVKFAATPVARGRGAAAAYHAACVRGAALSIYRGGCAAVCG